MQSPDPPDLARILLGKAAEDEFALRRLSTAAGAPEAVLGFHAQQAVEKLLKAVLASRSVSYPFTHDLRFLVELVEAHEMRLPVDTDRLDALTDYAAVLRYEDPLEPRPFDAVSTIALIERLRAWTETVVE